MYLAKHLVSLENLNQSDTELGVRIVYLTADNLEKELVGADESSFPAERASAHEGPDWWLF